LGSKEQAEEFCRNMNRLLLTFFLSIISLSVFAGNIKGKVTDASTGSPLSGVVVSIKNTDKGLQTNENGEYEFSNIANGSYELVFTYITYKKQALPVSVNGDALVNVKLQPEGNELKDVTVKTSRITRTENAVLMEIRKSNSVVSGISAAQISKTMDRNAADVVKRVPGVTIQDDRFIMVRGLFDRYNAVWLNDAGAPSSEVDKKSFSFDLIPSGLIDRILIFKTPSPELPGDFAGGMVKIYTSSMPEKNQVIVGYQTSFRDGSTGTNASYSPGSKTDWLGYDDGMRGLPGNLPAYINKADVQNNSITKSFSNDWIIKNKTVSPDNRFNFSLANVFNIKRVKIGNTLGVAYTNTSTNFKIHRQDWDSATLNTDYNDQQYKSNVSVGILENLVATVGNSKFEFKNLYNQIGVSSLTVRTSNFTPGDSTSEERSYAIGYESRATYASQLSGTHTSKDDSRKYTWTLGYTDLFKNQPDLRRIKYANQYPNPDSLYAAQVAPYVDIVNGGGRYYSSLYEHVYSFSHQLSQKIKVNDNYSFDVNLGNYIEYKSRIFSARQLGYTIAPGPFAFPLKHLPINEIFAAENVGETGRFKIDEATNKYDSYSAKNRMIASFVSVKLPLGTKINVSGGVRYEDNRQSLKTYLNQNEIGPDVATKFWLPSVNISYNLNEKSLIRVAYGKTLNRPEFREWSPAYFYDFDERAGLSGSLRPTTVYPNGDTLKVAEVQNYDARFEWYPSSGEVLHAGVFYKTFKNPIQKVWVPGSGVDSKAYTFINANDAYCGGVELEFRKSLMFIDNVFKTNAFKDFMLVGNLTLSASSMTIDTTAIKNQIHKAPLQGQSPYVVNIGAFYQNDKLGLQGSLLYNVFGARTYILGTALAGGETVGEMPFRSLDIAISKVFFRHYIINVGIQNMLNSDVVFKDDSNRDNHFDGNDKIMKSFSPGRYYTVGIKVRF